VKKAYFYSMCLITSLCVIVAIFATSNHFLNFYDVSAKNTNSSSSNKPNPNPNNPPADPKNLPVVDGYKCSNENCKKINSSNITNESIEIIADGQDKAVIYNKDTNKVERTYKTIEESGNLYIVMNTSGLYGLINIDEEISDVFDTKYKHIEYNSIANQYMITTSTASFIADEAGTKLSPDYSAQIVQYNDKYIITKSDNGEYHIFDFQNKELLREYVNSKRLYIELVGDFVGVITDSYLYRIYDFRNGTVILGDYQITDQSLDIRARFNDSKIEIYKGNQVLKTIDF